MAWASNNQYLKFPNAGILTTKPEEIYFPPLDFLRRELGSGFDPCLVGINKYKILKLQKVVQLVVPRWFILQDRLSFCLWKSPLIIWSKYVLSHSA